MNANNNEADKLPDDVELLLPWHAAGTLSRRDATRVEQALANDNELAARYELVREELGESIRLNESLGAPSARAMHQLFAKIDAEPARQQKVSFNLGAWLASFVAGFSPRTLAYGGIAAALAIVLQAGVLTSVLVKQGGGYEVSNAASDGAYVVVRFKPEASAADITKFLADNKAGVVSGPAPGGLFKLRIAESRMPAGDLAATAKRFATSPVIDFSAASQ
jgi:hypothetical protein